MMFFKKKFKPDLMNLDDYRYSLLQSLDNDGVLRPPFPIFGNNWSCEEKQAMKKNRRLAQDIYEEIESRLSFRKANDKALLEHAKHPKP